MVCIATQYAMTDVDRSAASTTLIAQGSPPCQSVYLPQNCHHLCLQMLHLQDSLTVTREELQALRYSKSVLTSSSVASGSSVMKRYSYSPLMQLTFKALSYLVWLIVGLAIALSLTHVLNVLPLTTRVVSFVAMLLKPFAVIVLGLIAITVFKESL
ncbi:MAG: hypothetical protein AAGF93_17830 [Cyanobacteria bacterium P01_H01_bin.105]